MCGIVGLVALGASERPRENRLVVMRETLRHRGPDDAGVSLDGPVALGMRRLAVIDPLGGRQPARNEDGSVRVVCNGEIYNYRDLAAQLRAQGHQLRSDADTEVLPHLWERDGLDFLRSLDGMFALALHDAGRQRLVLARDPIGVKPLFYALQGGWLVFGSEIKALLASGLVARTLDVDSLGQLLAWEYVPGEATLLSGVRKLAPGHALDVDLATGGVRDVELWRLPLEEGPRPDDPQTAGEWVEAVDAAIAAAVRRQLVSDVPLGALLSGGVDSSTVVAAMGPVTTFSLGFSELGYDELPFAAEVAAHLGLPNVAQRVEGPLEDLFDELMPFLDDPITDSSVFPTWAVCRFARASVAVVLTGDGGDELFGGYDTHVAQQLARRWELVPSALRQGLVEPWARSLAPRPRKKALANKVRRFAEGLARDPALGHARWRVFVDAELRSRLFTPEARAELTTPVGAHVLDLARRAAGRDDVDRSLFVDFRSYLVDNCLVKVDRMSMAHSLEARVPLLDRQVVELAFRMPSRFKVRGGRGKILLKEVAERHVPRRCVRRTKQGFSSPVKEWLRGGLRPRLEDLLAPGRLRAEGLFEPAVVGRLKDEHLARTADHSHVLWALMVFQDWRLRWAA
jgi:asparagine synthase (glutamine-hydrolysing)